MPLQGYPWTLLSIGKPFVANFESSGSYSWHKVRFSISGVRNASYLRVSIDGEDLGWEPRQGLGVDRWHYDYDRESPLSAGTHELKCELVGGEEGEAQLCSYEILEFGDDSE